MRLEPSLPARTAAIAATAATVTAVATAAAITAVAAEAASTTTPAAAAARPAAFATLVRGIHAKRSTIEHLSVHGVGCRLGFAFGCVFDESKSARSAGFTIDDH